MSLFSPEETAVMHEKFHQENPTAPRSRCHQCYLEKQRETSAAIEFVCQIVREDSTITVKELAFAVQRRPSWVRRNLKENKLSAPEAVREPILQRSKRPCARCGHLRHCHCSGLKPRLHIQNSALGIGSFICPRVRHCKGVVEQPGGQYVNCSCAHFTTSITVEKEPRATASFATAASVPANLGI
jgi:hypothetical protein